MIPTSPSDGDATSIKIIFVNASVDTPLKIWSALESTIAILIPFAQDPGFFAANTTPWIVFSSYPSSS